jgi:hypothetical protein
MPLLNGVPLPHEGRARYPLSTSHVVIIDLDAEHVVIEVPARFRSELGGLDTPTLTLQAGELIFFYYLKTPAVMELLNSWNLEMN